MYPIEPLGGSGVFKTTFRSVGFLWEGGLQTERLCNRENPLLRASVALAWPDIYPLGYRLILTFASGEYGI